MSRTRVAHVMTRERSVRLPPGVLDSGAHDVLLIAAERSPGVDKTRTLLRQRFPHDAAEALSGLLTAP